MGFEDQVTVYDGQEESAPAETAMVAIESARAVQEVQAAIIVAQRFRRDEVRAERRILDACKRLSLAERAQYAYPRGGVTVAGPSIRLAEVLARHWGNLHYGIRELSQSPGMSEMEAFCHDWETNVRATRVFQVKHIRWKKSAGAVKLQDPRDIYEMTANQGARRLRAAILEVIPGDIVDAALEQCNATLAGGGDEPLIDRIKKMTAAFEALGVSQEMIEARVGKKVSAILPVELVTLRNIYQSLKDNMSKIEDWFAPGEAPPPKKTEPEPPDNEPDREALKARAAELDLDFSDRTRTTTLQAMIEEAEAEAGAAKKVPEQPQEEPKKNPPPQQLEYLSKDQIADLKDLCYTEGVADGDFLKRTMALDWIGLRADLYDEYVAFIKEMGQEAKNGQTSTEGSDPAAQDSLL